MWVISKKRLREFWSVHADARCPLRHWHKVVTQASWSNLSDVRRQFPHADPVTTRNETVMTLFNIGGNKYRLIARVVYQRHKVYVKQVLTHAEYSKGDWKDAL